MIDSASSVTSDELSQGSFSEDEAFLSTIPTPLTPASSRPSPRHPSELKNYHCSYQNCLKSFNRPARLKDHLRSHTNERPFICPHSPCTKDFLRASHLKHHIKSAHADIRDYVCEWEGCGKSFSTGSRLKRHLAAHEGREQYRCAIAGCGQTFRKHSTLQKHIAIEHEGRKPFMCTKEEEDGTPCEIGFDTAGKLKKHDERVHGIGKFRCTICGVENIIAGENEPKDQGITFSTYAAFQSHNRNFHSPTCAECGLECGSSKELTRHLEIHHGAQPLSERQTHTCTERNCGRSFTSKANLNTHIRVGHMGERRFVCGEFDLSSSKKVSGWDEKDTCGKSYTTKANLEEHVRTVHMGLDHVHKAREKKTRETPKTQGKSRSTKKPSAISRLVGSAYDEDESRSIACLQLGCDLRFIRDYDLQVHLQGVHGLTLSEIEHQRAEREGKGPSMYGYTLRTEHLTADQRAKMALESQSEILHAEDRKVQTDVEGDVEEAALLGGDFWVGGSHMYDIADEWEQDEMDMRELIDKEMYADVEGKGGPDGAQMMIDPVLK